VPPTTTTAPPTTTTIPPTTTTSPPTTTTTSPPTTTAPPPIAPEAIGSYPPLERRIRRIIRRRLEVRCIVQIEIIGIVFRRIPFIRKAIIEAEVWPPLEVIEFKRTPFYERINIDVSIIRRFEEKIIHSFIIWEILENRIPFEEAIHLEGYTFNDVEILRRVEKLERGYKLFKVYILSNGLEKEESHLLLSANR